MIRDSSDPNSSNINRSIDAYVENIEKLVKSYSGQYVGISHGSIIATGKTLSKTLEKCPKVNGHSVLVFYVPTRLEGLFDTIKQ